MKQRKTKTPPLLPLPAPTRALRPRGRSSAARQVPSYTPVPDSQKEPIDPCEPVFRVAPLNIYAPHNADIQGMMETFLGHDSRQFSTFAPFTTGKNIPSSLTKLGSLGVLKMSLKHFSGPIPSAHFFTTKYTNASFIGNPGLCGAPLTKLCPIPSSTAPENDDSSEETSPISIYGIIIGFCIGITSLLGAVFLWKTPRDFIMCVDTRQTSGSKDV